MKIVQRIPDLRDACERARAGGGTVGFVPTMGYFHEGHLSLMRAARPNHDLVVVSIFVNPIQFGADEDLGAYPRALDRDVAMAESVGVDTVFVPSLAEMYPDGAPMTRVHVSELTDGMCGQARPVHFDGVTTVCAKLFSIVGPCSAYFGRKDFQQLRVVARMARDLDFPVRVVGCPLVREPDGLAMSSRNAYLGDDDRRAAAAIFRALGRAADAVERGERSSEALCRVVRRVLAAEPRVRLEYCEIRSTEDLRPLETLDGEVLVAVAAEVGSARLIDNVVVSVAPGTPRVDAGIMASSDTASTH